MNTRRIFLSSLLVGTLAIGTVAMAGPHGKFGGGDNAERSAKFMEKRLDRMSEKLDLTAEQKTQMKAVMEGRDNKLAERKALREAFQKLDPTSASYEADLKALAAKKAAMSEEATISRGLKRQKVAEILTPEQLTKMEEMKAKRGGKRGHRGHGKHRMGGDK